MVKSISSETKDGFFHIRFLLLSFLKLSTTTATLAICSGWPGPVSWFWDVFDVIKIIT